MDLKVNENYKTRGGWKAKVIWERKEKDCIGQFFVIHKPDSPNFESGAIIHLSNGKPRPLFSIGEAPNYFDESPADIIGIWDSVDERREAKLQLKVNKLRQNAGNN